MGVLNSDETFVFGCGNCGQQAAKLSIATAGSEVDIGPLPGGARLVRRFEHPSIRLDFFGISAREAPPELLQMTVGSQELDARRIRELTPDLAPFFCPECDQTYCLPCWKTRSEFDQGFYDSTWGECPRGHRHLLDD
jgi:predicted RNA-binding Zn-ribbon protein involved in translation (DUF1610 family)